MKFACFSRWKVEQACRFDWGLFVIVGLTHDLRGHHLLRVYILASWVDILWISTFIDIVFDSVLFAIETIFALLAAIDQLEISYFSI